MLKFFIKAITRILSTNLFSKLLFGVDCSKGDVKCQIGFSTILMKKALKKHVKSRDKVLDIGTGAFAIHGIWLKKNIGAGVVATEIDRRYIESARKVMKDNKVNFRVIKSDLFRSVRGKFNWAIFNPPLRSFSFLNGGLKIAQLNFPLTLLNKSLFITLKLTLLSFMTFLALSIYLLSISVATTPAPIFFLSQMPCMANAPVPMSSTLSLLLTCFFRAFFIKIVEKPIWHFTSPLLQSTPKRSFEKRFVDKILVMAFIKNFSIFTYFLKFFYAVRDIFHLLFCKLRKHRQ